MAALSGAVTKAGSTAGGNRRQGEPAFEQGSERLGLWSRRNLACRERQDRHGVNTRLVFIPSQSSDAQAGAQDLGSAEAKPPPYRGQQVAAHGDKEFWKLHRHCLRVRAKAHQLRPLIRKRKATAVGELECDRWRMAPFGQLDGGLRVGECQQLGHDKSDRLNALAD